MNGRRFLLLLSLLTLVTVGACQDAAPDPQDDAPTVHAELALEIADRPDEGLVLGYVPSATRLPSGTVVILDSYGQQIHFVAADGTYLRSVGRAGEGPGEIAELRWIGQCGDGNLSVWDYVRRVVMVLDTTGAFIREVRPPGTPHAFTCARSGLIVGHAIPSEYPPMIHGYPRPEAPMWVSDASFGQARIFDEVPVGDVYPMGRVTKLATSKDRIFVGTADSAWVDVYDASGQPIGTRSTGAEPAPPTRAQYEAAIEADITTFSDPRTREWLRDTLPKVPMPDRAPAYSALAATPEGTLWATVSLPGEPETVARATRPDGTVSADVTLPAGFLLLEAGEDYLLGTYPDAVGAPRVAVFEIHWGGAAGG